VAKSRVVFLGRVLEKLLSQKICGLLDTEVNICVVGKYRGFYSENGRVGTCKLQNV